jgi:hypothetical protein
VPKNKQQARLLQEEKKLVNAIRRVNKPRGDKKTRRLEAELSLLFGEGLAIFSPCCNFSDNRSKKSSCRK